MTPARRGEVWLLDLGQPKDDHEQAGRRPAVILQTDDLAVLNTVVIVPLTTQSKRAGFASTVWIPANEAGQDRDSVALCLCSARIMCAFMLRPFPASTRDAVRRSQLCGGRDGLAGADVDAPFGAAKGEAAPGYLAPGSCERGRDCSGVPNG